MGIRVLVCLRALGIAAIGLTVAASAGAQIVNGSFGTGDFTGWTESGFIIAGGSLSSGGPQYSTYLAMQAVGVAKTPTDGVETSQTTAFDGFGVAGPAILPTSGSFLAFVANETSAGNDSITGTSISQTFTIPSGATQLTFDVRLLNNDSASDFASFDDFGGVALTQGATILAQFNADLDPASAANIHVTALTGLGGFQNSTPWTTGSFNVAGLVGQTVTLTIYATNYGGDNSVETRLLIDNIQINGGAPPPPTVSAPVPALSGWMLVVLAGFLGLTGAALLLRRSS